jgi:hypothetical protein
MPRILFLFLILIALQTSYSQTATGSWYGKADVMVGGNHNNYLTELILRQKGNQVEGIFGYYFKDSYQSFFIRGTYNPKSREININKIPVIFYASANRDGIECPMDFIGILMVSKVKTTVRGSFYSMDKYKYTCPEIKVNFQLDVKEDEDSVLKTSVAAKKIWKPQQEDFVVSAPRNELPQIETSDVSISSPASLQKALPEKEEQQLVEKFEQRKNIYNKDLEIESDSIRISFYDNGDIDGDSISVFLNKKPVLTNQILTSRSLNLYLALDTLTSVNEISMFADNLGRIPPNTALMVISDGINRYEVYLSSSLTQNGAVRLKRKKKSS